MKFIGDCEREFPGFGVFKPGDVIEFDETLFATGFFEDVKTGGAE